MLGRALINLIAPAYCQEAKARGNNEGYWWAGHGNAES